MVLKKNHISKVLQRLVKHGVLKSVRGPQGGFSLKIEPEAITLLNIYESIEGTLQVTDCPMSHEICGFDNCIMGNIVNKMTTEFRKFLNEQSLKDYL